MAGIAGIVYPDLLQTEQLIDRMLQSMQHRSPQQEIYQNKNVQLGICGRKLAQHDKESIVLVDGNIYNRQELCKILSLDDKIETEALIAYAYREWGEAFASQLRGEFAIAVFDLKKNFLLLIKDRLGNKPLYWYHDHHHFIFGSEIKSLLITGAVPPTPSSDGLAAYLSLGYIPQDMTPIQNINKLLPGHYLRYIINGYTSIHSYWSYSSFFLEKNQDDPKTSAQKLGHLLAESTQIRLPSSGKVGCFVAGGLGSSTVAYEASTLYPQSDLSIYSVGFQGQNDNDIKAVIKLNKKLNLQHIVDWVTPKNWLDDLVKIVWYLDEPMADPNILATWKMAQLASNNTPIVLAGAVSDELLAHNLHTTSQYHTRFKWLAAQSWMKHLIFPILKWIPRHEAYSWLKDSKTAPWQSEYLKTNALFDEENLALAAPELSGLFDPQIFLHKFHHLSRIQSKLGSFLYFDVKTRIPDLYLSQYERLTSAYHLDWRTPFLDSKIVEYLATCPQNEQFVEQHSSSFLKVILKDIYPSGLLQHPKDVQAGFLSPWTESSEIATIFECLNHSALVESGIISSSWLKEQMATPKLSRLSFSYLWSILILEIWFQLFVYRLTMKPPSSSLLELLSETNNRIH